MNSKRIIGAVAVIAMAAGAALIAGSFSSSTPNASAGSGGGTSGGTGTQASSSASTTSRCTTSSLEVWPGVGPGGAAAGSTYMPIEFTNTGSVSCTLHGYPGVSARSTSQLGSPASRNSQVASKT